MTKGRLTKIKIDDNEHFTNGNGFFKNLDLKDGKRLYEDSKTDLTKRIPFPPTCIGIGTTEYGDHFYPIRFGTYGNISLIRGQEKSRKSFFKSLLLAGAIGGKANNYC